MIPLTDDPCPNCGRTPTLALEHEGRRVVAYACGTTTLSLERGYHLSPAAPEAEAAYRRHLYTHDVDDPFLWFTGTRPGTLRAARADGDALTRP